MRLLRTKLEKHWGQHLRVGKKRKIPQRSPGRTSQWRQTQRDVFANRISRIKRSVVQ